MCILPDVADEVLLTRIALRGGAPDAALRAADAAERRSAANPGYAVAAAVANHARGLLSGDEGHLSEAVRLLHDTERPLRLASAREDLARVVGRDRPREAIELLDHALTTCTAAGAEHDAGRTRRRLRELGVQRRRTNAQVATEMFVSPHTVDTHLRNAFVELGVRSRLDVARLVPASGAEPG